MDRRRLLEAVGTPQLRWIWERVQARILRGSECVGTIRLDAPTEEQRGALARLLGRRPKGEGLAVSLEALEAQLREGGLAGSLEEAAREVLGEDAEAERGRRLTASAQWEAEVNRAIHERSTGRADLDQAIREVAESALLRRLSGRSGPGARRLLDGLRRLGERLPAEGIPLAQLAAEVAGDAHALDGGAPLGTLGTRLAARLGGAPGWDDPEDRREAWARAGVLCDELSAPALALNLSCEEDSAVGDLIRLHARTGEPLRLSIRQLVRGRPSFAGLAGRRLYVCENPTVLAASANAHGAGSAPMVCTEGVPRTAVRMLLDGVRRAGAQLAFHADFDWAGVRIGNLVASRHGGLPWRMSAEDYEGGSSGPPLEGAPVAAGWDEALAPRMQGRGSAVHEEAVLGTLLGDLGA